MRYSNDVTRYTFSDIDRLMSEKRDGYLEYKKEFENSYELFTPDRPMYLDVELNNYCNMRCKMCVKNYDYSRDGKDNMDLALFRELVRQGTDMNVPSYFIGGFTECLINPQIREYLRILKENGNSIEDVLITNGYELNEEIIDFLIELEWEKVFISLDAAKPETYKKIRGRDLEHVENNIKLIIKKKKDRGAIFPLIRLSFVIMRDNIFERELFIDKWKEKVDIIDFQPLSDYSNVAVEHDLPEVTDCCSAPFNRLYIDWEGNVYPCCTEYARFMKLGNIKEMSLDNLWNCNRIMKLRQEIKSHRLSDICKSCFNSIQSVTGTD